MRNYYDESGNVADLVQFHFCSIGIFRDSLAWSRIYYPLGFFEILWDSLGPLEFLGIFKDSL